MIFPLQKRAVRRHHRKRLKAKRKQYWGAEHDVTHSPRKLGMLVNTPCVCSCHGCGNPRKNWKEETPHERRMHEVFRYDVRNL
ncbi:MAG: hypothetical protein AB8F95_04850 [Bacteroidia bacterium]